MKLSVIIVNYNVRAYLEQCLRTVFEALEGMDGEVFVVDNLSTDGSVEMVRERFPQVRLIANQVNVGFSRANNQAIRESKADHVVLLNPDTVVGEDVFRKAVSFMDGHPRAGGLGVKMIDGTGRFLPESKRGLPTPGVAFYKIIGLTRLFPRSKVFGRYHLGHLAENEAAPIEILSGACMFLRKRTLDEVGLLDENFFMYGEDIDLSYRITLGGYENWYLPEARIIHYKGESTKKSSVNYVFVFYNAMAIFAKKHFTRKRPDLFAGLITASIYLSAAAAIAARFLRRALLPILDAVVLCLVMVMGQWAMSDPHRLAVDVGGTATLGISMLLCFALCGAYDVPVRLLNVLKGTALLFVGAMLWYWPFPTGDAWNDLLAGLARWAILYGALAVLAVGLLTRGALHLLRIKRFNLRTFSRRRIMAIGSAAESKYAMDLLWQTHFGLGRQTYMEAGEATLPDAEGEIKRRIRRQGMDEVVFCAKDLRWGRIIALIEALRAQRVMFKIAQPEREFIIGPNSIESVQDLLVLEEYAVNSAAARRRKRVWDVTIALALLVTLPVNIWFVRARAGYLRNLWSVARGRRSWVGYAPGNDRTLRLPRIRPGVLDPVHAGGLHASPVTVRRVNLTYAKDYRVTDDLRLVFRGFQALGDH